MSPLMRSECRKFSPNIFNKTKCTNCFRQKEEHTAEALESNRATRKVCKCGYLFVAPDWDFSNPVNRTKRWQRRWFILYDDGELTYSVDEHPDTVPQAVISLLSSSGQGGGSIVWEAPESETGHPHSLAIAAPDRVHFVRGDGRDETRAWLASLLAVASPLGTQGSTRIRQARHKRNATFPGGRSNPLPMGVPQRVISGTTAVSQQHSPVLRQRFNSCISPLHHDSEVSEGDGGQPFNLSPTSLSALPSSSKKKSLDDSLLSTPRSVEDSSLLRSLISETDSSSLYLKELNTSDVFLRSTHYFSPNNRLFSGKSDAEEDIKEAPTSKSNQRDSIGNESTKCSPMVSWKRYPSLSEERQESTGPVIPSEKNVRGDPDGCVLDSMSTSSCCSLEGSGHVKGMVSKQLNNDSTESRSTKDVEEEIIKKDLWKYSVGQDATKHGWLMKLGASKEWSKHWFVLCGTALLYYRDPSAIGILDGVIDLGLVSDVRETAVERNHGLQLTTWDGKHYILSAITPGIRTGWIEALRKAAGLLPFLSQRKSTPRQYDKYNDLLGMSAGNDSSNNISDVLSQCDAVLANPSELMSIISTTAFQTSPISSKPSAEETSCKESPSGSAIEHSEVNKKYGNRLIDSRLCSSLCTAQLDSSLSSGPAQKIDNILREISPCVNSELAISGTTEILLDSKELQDKGYAVSDQMSVSKSSADCSQRPDEQLCINPVPSFTNLRGMIHKPPVSPALNSACPRTLVGRRNSNGFRSYDRSSSSISVLDSSLDYKRPERPNHLSLPSAESKCPAPVSLYISSSASSCSLSDEDFRTASEASQNSTPVAECVVDGNSNLWAKNEVVNLSSNSAGADIGTVPPPSPPLNRTPISRVKERARSRVVKRSKTPPEEDLKSAKIDSLTKRVKELMATLASKEVELMKEKSKESASPNLFKKRLTMESESKVSLPNSHEKIKRNVSALKQNLEDEINSLNLCPKPLLDRPNEDGRLCSSSAHTLPRMGSLSDLTNVDLDLDLNSMDHERLVEEWFGLRARFEKAVREIHALRKELRACQGHVDALELEGSAVSMCLAEERKRAEADMRLMASRIQDLTVKLSASEKQVRQLKQKTSRVETREKRRSLSLRSERDVRSGTDPTLCTGKLPKEICDRLTQLEDTLAAAIGKPLDELKMPSQGCAENYSSQVNVGVENKASLNEPIQVAYSNKDGVNESDTFSKYLNSSKEIGKVRLEEQTSFGSTLLINNTSVSGVQTSQSHGNGSEEEIEKGKEKSGVRLAKLDVEGCSASERKRIEGRRQRMNCRILRRSVRQEASYSSSQLEEEQIEEEARTEDDSSKKCDPLRILVRLSSLEGRVADFLKTAKNEKKMENVDAANEKSELQKMPGHPCQRCEEMRLAMDRMKEELMLVNNDGSVMLDRYREEIEQLRALCEKGMRAMDVSHQRLIKEMEEKHREEVNRVLVEKEQALREETKATLAALDAMRKAHETEVQREVAKFKEEFSRRMSAKQELTTNHQAEMEGIRREILSLSQRYSSKCVECASLREQLRIARGMKDSLNESYREVLSEHS